MKKTTKGKYYFHRRIILRVHTTNKMVDDNCDCLAEMMSVSFLHWKVTLFIFLSILCSLKNNNNLRDRISDPLP